MKKLSLLLIMILWVSACSKIEEASLSSSLTTTTTTGTTTYDCTYFGTTSFNSLTDCENETSANCSSQEEIFPNGGIQNCYQPVSGWESCASNPASWIYTPWSYCTLVTDSGTEYEGYRSAISCSSSVCVCPTQSLIETCPSLAACGLSSAPAACP